MGVIQFLTIAIGLFQFCYCDPFSITISTAISYTLGEDIMCKVTIVNTHNTDYYLLKRNTPFDEIGSDIFSVRRDDEVLEYEGLLYQRMEPTTEEYVLIPAMSSISSEADLSRSYSISKTGAVYTVKMDSILTYFKQGVSNTSYQHAVSNQEVFGVAGESKSYRLTDAEVLRRNVSLIKTLDFDMSTFVKVGAYRTPAMAGTPRGNDIQSALNVFAASYNVLPKSFAAVDSNTRNLYTDFFGLRYSGYMDTVKGAYLNIKYAMENYQFTIYFDGPECLKIQNVVAYTFKGSKVLYVCSIYRTEPDIRGTNTKLGTIVHELTHAVAYTDDITYGKANCLNMARNNPGQAIKNADNYHYFSEPLAQ